MTITTWIYGAISSKSFVEIKSAPLFSFGFNCRQIWKMSISEILENLNVLGLLSDMKFSNFISDGPISSASLGPIPAKNVLNHLQFLDNLRLLGFWKKKLVSDFYQC